MIVNNNRRGPSGNFMMRLAGVLFCLVMISTYMMGGLFARYVARGSGSDSARVIKFGDITVEESGDFLEGNTMVITPGVDITKEAVVHFEGSEAAVYVFLEVALSDIWETNENGKYYIEDKLTWQIHQDWNVLEGYENVFYMPLEPNQVLSAGIIRDNTIYVSEEILAAELGELANTISFRARVVQSSGFESAKAAWGSLQAKEVIS